MKCGEDRCLVKDLCVHYDETSKEIKEVQSDPIYQKCVYFEHKENKCETH